MGSRTRLWRLLPLCFLAVAGLLLTCFAGSPQRALSDLATNGEWLRAWLARWGLASALAYVVVYAALMTMLWVPAWLCSIVGGFFFGLWLGTLCALLGATLGATAVFLLGRRGLGGMVERAGPILRRLEAELVAGGFGYLVVARLVPVFPFSAINIIAATTRIPLPTYVAATALGIVPSTFVYAGLGHGLSESLDAAELSHPSLIVPLIGLAVLLAAGIFYRLVHR